MKTVTREDLFLLYCEQFWLAVSHLAPEDILFLSFQLGEEE